MLELRNVTAGYGSHIVLRDVSLTVPDGAVVSLLGPNGAGKTTLLRVASGLLKPRSGSVIVDGVDVTGHAPNVLARRGVCHVPEGRGVFAAMTVAENLRLQSPPSVDRGGVAVAAAAFPKLGQRLAQRAGTMSGGEQQMLALAAAYLSDSKTVLLDEVSMGLAPNIVDEIFEHLERLTNTGAALLLVEQYVGRALALADYVYVLRKGRVDFVGEPGEIGESEIMAAYLGGEG